jgi:hypothetical protein
VTSGDNSQPAATVTPLERYPEIENGVFGRKALLNNLLNAMVKTLQIAAAREALLELLQSKVFDHRVQEIHQQRFPPAQTCYRFQDIFPTES